MRRLPRIALLTAVAAVTLASLAYAGVRTGVLPSPLASSAATRAAKPISVRLRPATIRLTPGATVRVQVAIDGRRWPNTGGTRARGAELATASATPRRGRVRLTVARPLPRGVTVRFSPQTTATRRATLTVRASAGLRVGMHSLRVLATRVRPRGAPRQRASTRLRAIVRGTTRATGTPQPDAATGAAQGTAAPPTPPAAAPGAGPRLLVGGDLRVSLAPGVVRGVDVKLANPFDEPLDVTSIDLAIDGVNAPNATPDLPCDLRDFQAAPMTGPPVRLPAQRVTSLSEMGIPGNLWPALTMLDRPVNQDGCKGAALTFHYRAQARSVDP